MKSRGFLKTYRCGERGECVEEEILKKRQDWRFYMVGREGFEPPTSSV